MTDNYDIQNFIRDRIISLRNSSDNVLSARELSAKINQNENYINQIENGRNLPSYDVLDSICKYYNISLAEFFDDTNSNPARLKILIESSKGLTDEQINSLIIVANTYSKSN